MRTFDMYDNVIAALCVWREARGEEPMVQFLVARVIVNRVRDYFKRWPNTLSGVVLQRLQFSSFNSDDPNTSKMPLLTDVSFVVCCDAVDKAFDDTTIESITLSPFVTKMIEANHYHDDSIEPPAWAKNMKFLGKLGRILFYKA